MADLLCDAALSGVSERVTSGSEVSLGTDAHRFVIGISAAELDDLQDRLARTRWPTESPGARWERGTDLGYLKQLVERWRRFDWLEVQAALNELPHHKVSVSGVQIHFVHMYGGRADAIPLLLIHGWPSTFFEFSKIAPLLTDTHRRDGTTFDVVVPSLPGYGFSDRLPPTDSFNRVPELLMRLMTDVLGYQGFVVHGDDIGAMVANRMAVEFPDHLIGVHVTFPPEPAFGPQTPPTQAEQKILDSRRTVAYWGNAYAHIAATRPQTLAYALNDSPAGFAAWVIDKLRDWSDCDGDLSRRFTHDELLTWISLYWLSDTVASSLDPYWDWALGSAGIPAAWKRADVPGGVDSRPLPPQERISVPAGVTIMNGGPVQPPREWAQRSYADLRYWNELPHGGHFAAWEEPMQLANELRKFRHVLDGGQI